MKHNEELTEFLKETLRTLHERFDVDNKLCLVTKDDMTYGGCENKQLGVLVGHMLMMKNLGPHPLLMCDIAQLFKDYCDQFSPSLFEAMGEMMLALSKGSDVRAETANFMRSEGMEVDPEPTISTDPMANIERPQYLN